MTRIVTSLLLLPLLVIAGCDSGTDAPPNQPPSVDFSYTPNSPRAGTTVNFTANANDPDGDVVSYSWDFDSDGVQDASGPNPSHEFPSEGNFAVTLEVTDNEDATNTASESISVSQQYTRVRITDVVIEDMPFTNDSGQPWDFSSGPDVYFSVFNETDDEFVSRSNTINNVEPPDLPISPSGGEFTITNLSDEYSINLIDDDTSDDDFIGGIIFEYGNLIEDYPGSIELDAGGGIVLDVSLEWLE